jgi:predicted anti-sigma-YlaC factor YlaD
MNKNQVTCKDVMHHVCESLGEDLNSSQCAAIKVHLDECQGCQNYFNSVEATIDFYRKYNVEPTKDAHNRLMTLLGLKDSE